MSLPKLSIFSCGLLIFLAGHAEADWTVEPYAKSALTLDDNIRFSTTDAESSAGLVLDSGAVFSNETEAVKTRVAPKLTYRAYSSDSDINSLDQYLDFSTTSFGERSDLGLNLFFANDTTLISELDDSGITSINKRRRHFSMVPSWRYLLTQRLSLFVKYRFDGFQYEDSGENGLYDFEYQFAGVDVERKISEDSDFITRLKYQRYKALELTNKANTAGLELGYKKRFSSRLEAKIFVGGETTDSTIQDDETTKRSISAKVGVAYQQELQRISAELASGIVPSSTGEVYTENSLSLKTDARISDVLSWRLSARIQKRDVVNESSTQVGRTYYTVSPTLLWRYSREWTFGASYALSEESLEGSEGASRNQIYISTEYRKLKTTLY